MTSTFPIYPGCPVCGDPDVNPRTLAVRWAWDHDLLRAVGHFTPGPLHAGYANRMHGGILATLLDECLAWACAVACRTYCVTGDLQVRYRAAAALGDRLEISGRSGESWGRYVRAFGEVRSTSGAVIARATASFAALPRAESLTMREALRFAPGDLDVLTE